jgi:hypothetical protein
MICAICNFIRYRLPSYGKFWNYSIHIVVLSVENPPFSVMEKSVLTWFQQGSTIKSATNANHYLHW